MFVDKLKIALTLTANDKSHAVNGGRVMSCALGLAAHGFGATVTFCNEVSADHRDEIIEWFGKEDLIEARLVLAPSLADPPAEPIVIRGLVTEKALVENSAPGIQGNPIILRQYTVHFADAATVLWRQHFPFALFADTKLADVISAQLADGMKLKVELANADVTKPVVCLALGESRVSFYDFVLWYADRAGGCFYYDYREMQYHLAPKQPAPKNGRRLHASAIQTLRTHYPATLRHSARVLNAHTAAGSTTTPVAQPQAIAGIVRDRLIRTINQDEVEAATRSETARLRRSHPEVEVEYHAFPQNELIPGAHAALQPEFFSPELQPINKSFRVSQVSLSVQSKYDHSKEGQGGDERAYDVSLSARWESVDDERPRFLPYETPIWPIFVEGKIVCESGAEHDRTFLSYEDRTTALSHYIVHVPLSNQKIKVPFQPNSLPGHFYAPAFKDSRVLLALYFDHAEIVQFLDWGPGVELPIDRQGNHLLFGKNATSQTALKHEYVDDKPVFSVSRAAEGDLGLFQMEDGGLVLQIKEDASAHRGGATHDLTGNVAQANAQLEASADGSIAKVKAATAKGQAELSGKVEGARARTSAALEVLDAEVAAKASAGKSRLGALLTKAADKMAALSARAAAAVAELQANKG
jgi:hypothetical protein